MSPQTEEYEQIRQDTLISMVKVVVNIVSRYLTQLQFARSGARFTNVRKIRFRS